MITSVDKRGTAGFVAVMSGIVLFILLPLFCVITQKSIVYHKRITVHRCVDLAVMAAYLSTDGKIAGMGNQVLSDDKFNEIFNSVLCKNLSLDNEFYSLPDSIATGKVEIIILEYENENIPVQIGRKTLNHPYIHCEIIVPIKPDFFINLITQPVFLHENIYVEMPFDK